MKVQYFFCLVPASQYYDDEDSRAEQFRCSCIMAQHWVSFSDGSAPRVLCNEGQVE